MSSHFIKEVKLVFIFFCVTLQLAEAAPGCLFFKNDAVFNDSTRHRSDSISKDIVENISSYLIAPSDRAIDLIFLPNTMLADSIAEQRARAHSLRDEVEQSQRFRETLDASTVIDLPIGIVKSGGALDYSIIVDRVTFSSKGAELTTFLSLTIPQTGDRIAFGGKIPLSKDGGIVGTARIYLLGDHLIKLNERSMLTLKGNLNANTFVEIDCNGFKAMSLEAEVEFSKDFVVPEDVNGNVIKDARLKFNFQTYLQDWNELLVKVSVPPFQVTGLDGVGFAIQDAYLDWSDLTNPTGLAFPQGYQSSYTTSGLSNMWRGLFIKKAELRLPSKFQEKQSSARTMVGVENLILDDTGFSGSVFAENIIKQGDMSGGWNYTVDQLRIGLVANQLQKFELTGRITVPALEKEGKAAEMTYKATRGADGNYLFAVTLRDKTRLPLWAADVTLYNGSSIIVKEKENKFYPTATLNGILSIRTLSNGPKAELAGVRFEQLVISSEAPYFRPGVFGFGDGDTGAKASGFPLVIRNIGIKSSQTDNKVGLSLDVTINIGGDPSKEGFSGTAGLIVWGKINATQTNTEKNTNDDKGNWVFDKVELTEVGLSIRKPNVYDLSGAIKFFDSDPVYGSGFKGELTGKLQKVGVKAIALFGKTDAYRYWFADALVQLKNGVQLAPGLAAYDFGGGFFSRMKQSTAKAQGIGQTLSGISYLPDENSVGLKAYLGFGGYPTKQSFNGEATLEVAMNQSGGINSVGLTGNAYFLTNDVEGGEALIKESAARAAANSTHPLAITTVRSQVYGNVSLLFDQVNDLFHGDVEVFANVAGGIVKGTGTNNKAGWAVLHFANDEWYVWIGTPDQPIGLEVARLFKSKSYFMMGKNLPGSPPPPLKVSEILGGVKLDYMRDPNALQSGQGFAFGMSFGVDTGDLRFLMFYGRFDAGTGFDIMMKNYGETYQCEGSNVPVGVNGWYANGQAYAFVQGKIGIRVNLKFYKGDYDIINVGAAAIMQAKGPNPFWMKGTVGGQYRILGGLIKGQCRFEVTVGKDCKPVGESNPLQDVNMIAEVSPAKGSKDVNVFNVPQAAFNIPVGEVFEITNSEGQTRYFKARLTEFSIKDGSSEIGGEIKWNATHDVAVLDSRDVLPSMKELKVLVKVVFEERIGVNWQSVVFDGRPVEEIAETNFTAGVAPDFISPSNVEISYPIAGQSNFYPREYNQGFIKLIKGQAYLFESKSDWIQKGRMTETQSKQYKEFDFGYNQDTKTITFVIPDALSNNKIYLTEILNIPKQNALLDANVVKVSQELIADDKGAAELTTKQVQGSLNLLEIKSLYSSLLRTSKFNSFIEKAKSISLSPSFRVGIDENVFQLYAYMKGDELFDNLEIDGSNVLSPLIQCEAILDKNDWYQNFVYPMVYEGYPLLDVIRIKSRDANMLGLPPTKSITINELGYSAVISDQNTEVTSPSPYSNIRYELMSPMYSDYLDIQYQLANYVVDKPGAITQRFTKILTNRFPIYRYGSYRVRLNYRIPGNSKVTSGYEWELFNSIPD